MVELKYLPLVFNMNIIIIINLFSVGIKIKDLMSKIATELSVTNKIQHL